MQTDKPLITIVMAVYHPRLDWLAEQLDSLNVQTYPNLELIVCDDGPDAPVVEEVFANHITAFPWTLVRNEKNRGSNKTFERLTAMAQGEYIAYCDQDDVWLPEKLTVLQEAMEQQGAILACSDMYIIDSQGRRTANSITQVRQHHVFLSGEGLSPRLLIANFVTGCTMLVRSKEAKTAIPFCPYMVHDHYLALFCGAQGNLLSLLNPLISYRIHNSNQTLAMAGVRDKESYLEVRIRELVRRLKWLQEAFLWDSRLLSEIDAALSWATARERYFLGERRAWKIIWMYRRFSPLTSGFELVMASAPQPLFLFFVGLKRKNWI